MLLHDWRVFAFASAAFAALTAIFGKVGVLSINSNLATFIRTWIVLLLTTAFITFRKEWQPLSSINQRSALFLILSGLATGGSWLCYYRALQLGPVSKVASIDKLSVVLVILISMLFLGESIDLKTILGGLFIVLGTIILIS